MDERRRTLLSIGSLFYTCKQSNWRSFPDITWNQMTHRFQTRSETSGTGKIRATFPQSYWFLYSRNNFESPTPTAQSVSDFHILIKQAAISKCPNNSFRASNELRPESYSVTSAWWYRIYRQDGRSCNVATYIRVVLDLSLSANTGCLHWDYSRFF